VWLSVLEGASVGRGVSIGPFSHLRPGAMIADDVVLGNYAEVKNSHIGAATQMHHFSYVGDAEVGERVNIGAGTITVNYSSETGQKSRTVVGDDASLGSDTLLVAPVEVGQGAMTAAGAVVTHDIPAGEVWVGAPARPRRRRAGYPADGARVDPASASVEHGDSAGAAVEHGDSASAAVEHADPATAAGEHGQPAPAPGDEDPGAT
jgi:bifunctional UDP-N-acetylglucosamine pyrophosphorylase/glucosamine-1-phosphate N-acetyltransferase